ncbi:MAG: CBS and ACT domain-containing protein [Calditerrivibrio sp.]|nr:CBS and ACT domain-containing protein [Calditerrivibrio sp.]MCA1932579.1 CBS and ACT domain-containing protein [Calditerrivibrio sp.]MCA1980019.1 CBS and ACT domain-containing protein [Calditerrivibrio sp.]
MLIKDWMTKDVITIDSKDTMLDALHIMKEHKIRRLPVVHKGKLLGIVTEKDIKTYSPSKASTLDIYEMHNVLAETNVEDVMTKNVITVSPDDPIEKAALILRDKRIGGLPVVDANKNLLGLITAIDVFDLFVEAMGMRIPGARISIVLDDRPGAIAEMARIIKNQNLNIVSLATFFMKDQAKRDVVIRVSGEVEAIEKALDELKNANFNIGNFTYMSGKTGE